MYLVISSMFYPTKYLLDLKASQALRKIMDAMNIWADCIRVHPDDLVNDEPYNIIIFQPPVRYFIESFCIFKISNTFATDEEYADHLVLSALQMSLALQRIAQYYFNEAEVASPYISTLMEIDYLFSNGCDDLIKLLRAVKNDLRYNICICNTINSC